MTTIDFITALFYQVDEQLRAIPNAQFIAVCSSVKPCEIGENLLSVSDPIS
jgi:hypothetical protein